MRIDDSGFTEVSWKSGVIPWDHVESAFVKRVLARRYLCLRLRDEEVYLQRMPRFIGAEAGNMRSQGLTPFAIDSAGLDRPFDQVIDAVAARVPVDVRG